MSIEAMKQALEALEYDNPAGRSATITALRQAIEQAEMVKKGTKAWADTPDNWVDDLRGGAEIVPSDHTNSHQPVAWIKKDEIAYMSAVAGLGMTEWQTNLGLVHQLGDVPLYTTCPKNATTNGQEVAKSDETSECKTDPRAPHGFARNASLSADRYVCECEGWEPPPNSELVDWEAVAADQAMTIAMMKMEQKRDWIGLDPEMMRNTSLEFNRGALWAERYLKEKNHG